VQTIQARADWCSKGQNVKFKFEMTGFDDLRKRLADLQAFLQRIQGTLADDLKVTPGDERSVAVAIGEINATIDAHVGSLSADPVVASIVSKFKESCAEFIRTKAGL
jgi:hypothetical protein